MNNPIYKPFEQVLAGYYEFGNNYFVVLDSTMKHRVFTSIHERIHINIGSSTTMGMFQQLLHSLLTFTKYDAKPAFVESMHRDCLQEVRTLHEAAATYDEFCSAKHYNYAGLDDMEKLLPLEYKRYRAIFQDFFPEEIPVWARGNLGYHLARFAMNNPILRDYCVLSNPLIDTFHDYITREDISPNVRLLTILNKIEEYGKMSFFSDYLDCYNEYSSQLHKAYEDRTLDNRRLTFSIQSKLLKVMESSIHKLDEHIPSITIGCVNADFVSKANSLVSNWKQFLSTEGYTNIFELNFIDTDIDTDVDILDSREVYLSGKKPQTGLYPLEKLRERIPEKSSFIRLWFWKDDEQFLLRNNPPLYLNKNDIYLRLFQFKNLDVSQYSISSNLNHIYEIIAKYASTLFMDGNDYLTLNDSIIYECRSIQSVVYWHSFDHFQSNVHLSDCFKFSYIYLPNINVSVLLLTDSEVIFHMLIVALPTDLSLILSELSRGAKYVGYRFSDESIISNILILNVYFHELV